MKFEKSKYGKTLKHVKLEKPFGNFYLCDVFFIAELNEGVHFNWNMIKNVSADLRKFYDKKKNLGYISNRVNSYSMDPHFWNKFDEKYGLIVASAIVYYNEMMYMNAAIEKKISNKSIKRCKSLNEAIEWILSLDELNSKNESKSF